MSGQLALRVAFGTLVPITLALDSEFSITRLTCQQRKPAKEGNENE